MNNRPPPFVSRNMQTMIGRRVDVTFAKPARVYLPVLHRFCRVIAAIGTLREVDEFWATFDIEELQLHPDDAEEGGNGVWTYHVPLVYRIDDIISIAQTSTDPA